MPFRLFDRKHIYLDLKTKLLNNLILACRVAKNEGEAIIRRFGSLGAYFDTKNRMAKKKIKKLKNMANHQKSLKIGGI